MSTYSSERDYDWRAEEISERFGDDPDKALRRIELLDDILDEFEEQHRRAGAYAYLVPPSFSRFGARESSKNCALWGADWTEQVLREQLADGSLKRQADAVFRRAVAERAPDHRIPTDAHAVRVARAQYEFLFPDDAACASYLERLRWPNGFVCHRCGATGDPYRFPKRSATVLRCKTCMCDTSLTAGTVLHRARLPLTTWFRGAYLVIQKPEQSIVQFQKLLGISRYETAWSMVNKLKSGTVCPGRAWLQQRLDAELTADQVELLQRCLSLVLLQERAAPHKEKT